MFNHIKTADELRAAIAGANMAGRPMVLDLETTGLDPFKDTIVSAQMCQVGAIAASYIEGSLCAQLINLSVPIVGHNIISFDYKFLRIKHGIDMRMDVHGLPRTTWDTMLMHHLVNENADHSLDAIVQEKWGDQYKDVFWSRNKSFQEASLDEQISYACKDVVYTGKLYQELVSSLAVQGVPESLSHHIHKLAYALHDTEVLGVRVDLDYLSKVGTALKERIDSADTRMRALVPNELAVVETELWLERIEKGQAKVKTDKGRASVASRIKREPLNFSSGQQLQRLIYGELGLPVQTKWDKKNKERKPTLEDVAMEELAHLHPLVEEIRSHRGDEKVFGSFIEGTLDRQVGGRIFPSFHLNGTVTGRISSSNPNLQQLPREGGIRGIYVPNDGHKFISCDYGMLEVVVAAHYSQDPALLKIIFEGASKHDITAAALGIDRQKAKTLNFAMQYQCSSFKVAAILGCSKAEGQHAWNKYWEAYAGEKKVVDECKSKVDRGLPIVGLYGRRRRFPDTFASESERARCHRQAYSSLIQGSGSDIVHEAFYTVARHMEQAGAGRAILEVHDEILAEVAADKAEQALADMSRIMVETGVKAGLTVPLTVGPSGPSSRWED